MKRSLWLIALFLAAPIICGLAWPSDLVRADGVLDLFHPSRLKYQKQEPYKPNFGPKNDKPCLTMVKLANLIDIVERDLREDGTVVIQQPSVWGQARMTLYRKSFDSEMATASTQFKFILSARIARSDQAAFQSQTALGASLTTASPGSASSSSSSGNTPSGSTISLTGDKIISERDSLAKAATDLLAAGQKTDPIKTRDAFDLLTNLFKTVGTQDGNLGVEPTVFLDEKKNYLDHLNEIRRINMGDDTADSAGYGLYLVRMPVSIEPGQKTNNGHGAMLNVTAEHNFRPLFLQRTYRNLVINDLLDQLTPILFEILEHDIDTELKDVKQQPSAKLCVTMPPAKSNWTAPHPAISGGNTTPEGQSKSRYELREAVKRIGQTSRKLAPIARTLVNGKSYPVAPTDLISVFAGFDDPYKKDRVFSDRELSAIDFLKQMRAAQNTVRPRATDIRLFLQNELEAAYDIMERGIGNEGQVTGKDIPLCNFDLMNSIVANFRDRRFDKDSGAMTLESNFEDLMRVTNCKIVGKSMGILCWAIAVDAALLNERLRSDIERVNGHGGFHCNHELSGLFFYLPPGAANSELGLEAAEVFQGYIKARWPVLTFSLDPTVDQQNIADAYSLRRDLQMAVAYAFATGRISFSQMTSFHRQVAIDVEALALNRTVTCFSHGNDTFGWRFTPRYQNPPNPSNARTLAQLATWTGPGPNYQVNKSKLERGQRELTAVIVMPSFLNTINVDVRGNYFKLTHPENLTISSGRMLEQGRVVKELMECKADAVIDADKYRPEDIKGLKVKLDQVRKMLPIQSYEVNVPYENTLGGFDLFVPGTTALVPILAGYDGVDQVAPISSPGDANTGQTSFILYGKHFSILETKVVAGGRYVPDTDVEILSREVMRVKIQKDVQKTDINFEGGSRPFVEIHIATPNGVSNRVLIPIAPAATTTTTTALAGLTSKNVAMQFSCNATTKKYDFVCMAPDNVTLKWSLDDVTNATPVTLKFVSSTDKNVSFTVPGTLQKSTVTVQRDDTGTGDKTVKGFTSQIRDNILPTGSSNVQLKVSVTAVDGRQILDASGTVADPLAVQITLCPCPKK